MYKILVFGMTENPGGVESVIMNYYHYMDKNTFHFDFLCNSYNKIAFEEEIISNGSQTFHFPARSKNYKKYKKELKNFFENNASKYDAIWVNVCSLANIDYLKMAKKYGIKRRIIHSHNSQNMDSRLRGILHKYNKKRIAYYVTDFWSCSKEASEWFYDSSIIKKSIIISNAIDVEKYCFDDVKRKKLRRDLKWEENYIIGNIGRLHFQKNQMFILDIFEKLIKKEPKVRLILIGDGEDRTKLEKEIDKKKLNKYVYMAGIQKDICGWLSTFDLFLFPSKFEGLSMGNSFWPFAKIIDTRTYVKNEYSNVDQHLWIDIFPMDGLPDDKEESDILLSKAEPLKKWINRCSATIGKGKGFVRSIVKIPMILFLRMYTPERFGRKLDKLAHQYDFDKQEYIGGVAWSLGPNERMKKKEYLPYNDVEFCGKKFHAPACWKFYLTQIYGDYMQLPPESKRINHEFDAYIEG